MRFAIRDYFDDMEKEKKTCSIWRFTSSTGKKASSHRKSSKTIALKEIIRKKQKGEKTEQLKEPIRQGDQFKDALRQSVKTGGERSKVAAHHSRQPKKESRSHSRHKKAS